MSKFAVIDTETNWENRVMSIGTVIADEDTFQMTEMRYHVLRDECDVGGMYSGALFLETPVKAVQCSREDAMQDLCDLFYEHGVRSVFAYNAAFDRNHLPELASFSWYDIMRIAAYRQYNPHIPPTADFYSTGKLKRGYGVEPILRLLSGNRRYCETHNALFDALDELTIMRLLGRRPGDYIPL